MKELLIVNPGSTSTKVAVYYGSERKFSETISHPAQELRESSSCRKAWE